LQYERIQAADEGELVSVHAPDWTFRYASPTAVDVLGYRPEDLVDKWAYEIAHPDDVTRLILALRYAREASPFTVSYRARRGDGLHAWVETSIELREPETGANEEFICRTRPIAEPGSIADLHRAHRERLAEVERVLLGEELKIAFQPIVELETGRVLAYEALSRFPGDPARTPDIWFADAWALGLGIPLELLAIRKAVEAVGELPDELEVTLNASPPTLAARGFMRALGPDPGRMTIELTEHLAIEDYENFRRAAGPLREAGGRLAIDDFGAGFASLKHILKVEPDRIKLDISLTEQIPESSVAYALASALLSFAREIGVEVVAEGIETAEELDALTEIGIRVGQGFHFALPAPADQVLANSNFRS
jgi:EAL domain-containing protein (putative c-di-GMP-specific phosphodiesterase class I)